MPSRNGPTTIAPHTSNDSRSMASAEERPGRRAIARNPTTALNRGEPGTDVGRRGGSPGRRGRSSSPAPSGPHPFVDPLDAVDGRGRAGSRALRPRPGRPARSAGPRRRAACRAPSPGRLGRPARPAGRRPPSVMTSGMPPTVVATHARPVAMRLDQRDRQTLEPGAEGEHVEVRAGGRGRRAREPVNVAAAGEPEGAGLPSKLGLERARADQHQAGPGWSRPSAANGPQQGGMVLLGREVADRADHRIVGSDPELDPGPAAGLGAGAAGSGVDAVRDDLDRHPPAPHRPGDAVGHGDHGGIAPVGRRGWPSGSGGGTDPTGCARCGRTRAGDRAGPAGRPPRSAACGCGRCRCRRSRTSRRSRASQATLVGRRRVEAVDRHAGGLDVVDEGVLPRQQVGDLDPEAGRIEHAGRCRPTAVRFRRDRGPW